MNVGPLQVELAPQSKEGGISGAGRQQITEVGDFDSSEEDVQERAKGSGPPRTTLAHLLLHFV